MHPCLEVASHANIECPGDIRNDIHVILFHNRNTPIVATSHLRHFDRSGEISLRSNPRTRPFTSPSSRIGKRSLDSARDDRSDDPPPPSSRPEILVISTEVEKSLSAPIHEPDPSPVRRPESERDPSTPLGMTLVCVRDDDGNRSGRRAACRSEESGIDHESAFIRRAARVRGSGASCRA